MRSALSSSVIAVGTLAALVACDAQGDRRGLIFAPGMHYPVPWEAYDVHPDFGPVIRRAPRGTVPMHARLSITAPGPEGAERAGRDLGNPVVPTRENLARGQVLFDRFCGVCHGPKGEADGPIIGRFPNPPSLLADRARGLPDGRVFHVITHGQGIMRPYSLQVGEDDRWRIVHYVRRLQGQQFPEIVPVETSTPTAASTSTVGVDAALDKGVAQ